MNVIPKGRVKNEGPQDSRLIATPDKDCWRLLSGAATNTVVEPDTADEEDILAAWDRPPQQTVAALMRLVAGAAVRAAQSIQEAANQVAAEEAA